MESMRDRFDTVVADLLDGDPRVSVVLADIGRARLVERVGERHAERLINVGIREQAMIGVAAGMAHEGFRPIVHSYAPFLVERPYEQIKLDLGHQGLGAVLVSIGASYDAAEEGRTHQAPEDVALLAALPDWAIHVPGHADELESLLRRAVAGDGCHYVRTAEDANREAMPIDDGRWVRVREGKRAVVIAVGPMLDRTLAATADLDVAVLYAATVRPFDHAALRAAFADVHDSSGDRERGDNRGVTSVKVAMVEPYLKGTSAAEIQTALEDVPHRVLQIGVPGIEHRRYGTRHDHDAAFGLDTAGIRARISAFSSTA